jgi:hypothetical protein
MSFDPHQTLQGLAQARPVFASEADLQHAFAWQLHRDQPHLTVRLERRPLPEVREAADLWCTAPDGTATAIEMKYLVRAADVAVQGERFVLLDQSAHDIRRYDVIKDLTRVERWTASGLADRGLIIVLTNDPGYWQLSTRNANDAAFRLHEGRELTGEHAWAPTAGVGTTRGRTASLTIAGRYLVEWRDYAVLPNGQQVRALVLDTAAATNGGATLDLGRGAP